MKPFTGRKTEELRRQPNAWSDTARHGMSLIENVMTSTHLERYVLRSPKAGTYFRVNEQDQRIENVASPDSAWAFHSHEGAVTHARWMGQVMDETPDVVMLR
jgi:hypothetical protein